MIGVASAICSVAGWLRGVSLGCKYLLSMFFMELRLSSMNVGGSCRFSMEGGKLYVGGVV